MAKTDLPDLYTRKDVDNARTKGEVGGFVVYKLFSGPSKSD
ncbi:MAG TPA: hypothetical protein VF919_00560 [Gemmatimonadales bacterium]